MKNLYIVLFLIVSNIAAHAQYDNSEKLSVLAGFISTGSEFIFWSDNVYGGNAQLIYDVKKIHEGAIGLKASAGFSNGFQGYYGGANFRVGSRFFADMDLLFGYSSVNNEKLLSTYGANVSEYTGGAFVGNFGFGFRFANNPLFIRFAFGSHFPLGHTGLNTSYNFQLGYRIK